MSEITRAVIVAVIATIGIFAAWAVGWAVHHAARRLPSLARLSRIRVPFRVLVGAITVLAAMHFYAPPDGWHLAIHAVTLLVIAAGAWLLCSILFVIEDGALPRLRTDVSDNRHVRAVRTQLIMLRRVTAVGVTVLAVGAALMTFREARLVGTSLLASAGVAAAVAAFAANALLGNVVAGLQIAFSGSLRLEDVVVVDGEWGRIEEITLTYIVVHLWDDRRLVLPTSYFTTQSFENWTHTTSQLTGAVLLDVDWTVDVDRVRARLHDVVSASSLWDGRVCGVQMIDATGGNVQIRALVSAADAPQLWDLRCVVREALVAFIRETHAAPRARTEWIGTGADLVEA
ncbi:MAG TPA: mechanosensitive ion channel domain-containing protein [Micromonosporaceae bacterium]